MYVWIVIASIFPFVWELAFDTHLRQSRVVPFVNLKPSPEQFLFEHHWSACWGDMQIWKPENHYSVTHAQSG